MSIHMYVHCSNVQPYVNGDIPRFWKVDSYPCLVRPNVLYTDKVCLLYPATKKGGRMSPHLKVKMAIPAYEVSIRRLEQLCFEER
jgi:hypothetical protein